jgi:hypothetical protein
MPLLIDTIEQPVRGLRTRLPNAGIWVGPLAVAAFTLFNAAYVFWWCPHDLAPDEAHYWDWSRHLDWGYYSKGPLIAWLIRGGCVLFGDTVFGVRSVAVVCAGLLLLGFWRLTHQITSSPRAAAVVLLVAMSHPAAAAVGVVSTIDGPFLACWAWALVAAHRRRWLAAGILVAVGSLAKPTMLLFPASVLLLVLLRREWRTRRLWWFFPLSVLGFIQIIAWNATHDWVSVRHLFGHATNGGAAASWFSPLAFVGGQFALLFGVWFVLWVMAAWRFRPWRTTGKNACATDTAFLWCLSVPVFAVFLIASVKTAGELNWPAAAYLSGAVLVAKLFELHPPSPSPTRRGGVQGDDASGSLAVAPELVRVEHPLSASERGTGGEVPALAPRWRVGLTCAVALGLLTSAVVRWPGIVRPSLATVSPDPTDDTPPPVRRLDPTARLAGWRTLAEAVDEVRAELDDPVIVTMAWTVPGELAFYCDGHPEVYTFAPAVGDRFSQLDLWRPNPVADAQAFAGRTFVYVGTKPPDGVFERIEPVRRVTHSDGGVPLASWTVWVGRGYRGFDHLDLRPPRY